MSWTVPGQETTPGIGDNGGPPLDEPAPPVSEVPASFLNPIQTWSEAKGVVSVWTKHEMAIRMELAKAVWPEPQPGTNRVQLGDGYSLKMVFGYNYKLDKEKLPDVIAKLYAMGGGQSFVESVISYEPKLKESAYNGYPWDNPFKRILAEVVTVTPAAPQLELETPSDKIRKRKE